ncbi:hypothetical protein HN51_048306, partial [Arachis hypogaea]
ITHGPKLQKAETTQAQFTTQSHTAISLFAVAYPPAHHHQTSSHSSDDVDHRNHHRRCRARLLLGRRRARLLPPPPPCASIAAAPFVAPTPVRSQTHQSQARCFFLERPSSSSSPGAAACLHTKDFLILEGHEEAQEELPKKAKIFFSTAVQNWDADFYVKVVDSIDIDLEGLIDLLNRRRGQDGAYIGCMKSGEVISEEGKAWYEPEWWKFGDEKSLLTELTNRETSKTATNVKIPTPTMDSSS